MDQNLVLIQLPERSRDLLLKQQQILNAMVLSTRAALDVPPGYNLSQDFKAFVPAQNPQRTGGQQNDGMVE